MKDLNIEPNEFLQHRVTAYYHGYHRRWDDTEVGFINTLKNDPGDFNNETKDFGFTLIGAQKRLCEILKEDLVEIANSTKNRLTICVIPRSKTNQSYKASQLLFASTIKKFALANGVLFDDGTGYITRVADTPTTHITHDYESIKIGISKKTCDISTDVSGRDILLIDDIYTKSVNIDEDFIQALYDKGANSVIFYAIGNTI